jgi:hypothetical protein
MQKIIENLERELNVEVYNAYGLDDEDIRAVESFCRAEPHEDLVRAILPASKHGEVALAHWLLGVSLGRWPAANSEQPPAEAEAHLIEPSPGESRVVSGCPQNGAAMILVDDPGHPADITAALKRTGDQMGASLAATSEMQGYSNWLRNQAFGEHMLIYSAGRRSAPIYWRLSTLSMNYSIWIYYHNLSKDTFYTLSREYVEPKIEYEERRLGVLVAEGGDSPNAGQRRQIAEQEAFVEELRAFRAEVAGVAPLWNPNHDDGVIINFAPLWRMVPHHRAWQRECKACWDRLVAGDYHWSHLAMHLWPERVVPKCAGDRSLAIVHGLEDVFWFEDVDGKWKKREPPARRVEELVRERTSPAVKAALKSLLEAPSANGGSRRGRRRTAR